MQKAKRQIWVSGASARAVSKFQKLVPGTEFITNKLLLPDWDLERVLLEHFEKPWTPLCLAALPYNALGLCVRRGWIRSIDHLMTPKRRAVYAPQALKLATSNEKLYALPEDLTALILVVRNDILQKHGMELPQTWAEFEYQVLQLSRLLKRPCAAVAGKGMHGFSRLLIGLCGANGIDLGSAVGKLNEHDAGLSEVYGFLKRIAPAFGTTKAIEARIHFFAALTEGSLTHCLMDSGELLLLPQTVWKHLRVIPLPRGPSCRKSYICCSGSCWVIPHNAGALDTAFDLLEALIDLKLSKWAELHGGWAFHAMTPLWHDKEIVARHPAYRFATSIFESGEPIDYWNLNLPEILRIADLLRQSIETDEDFDGWMKRCHSDGLKSAREGVTHQRLAQALEFVDANLHRIRSIDDIADSVQRNPDYLNQLFMKQVGESCGAYLRRRRMERSKELLGDLSLSIKQIASAIGMPNISSFSRTFHNYWGISPTVMRYQIMK